MDLFTEEPRAERSDDIPQTEDQAIARFLTRWCHRAMGDRAMAEQELRELIAGQREKAE